MLAWPSRLPELLEAEPLADPLRGELMAQRVRCDRRRADQGRHERLHDQPETLAGQPLAALVEDQRRLRRVSCGPGRAA